MCSGRRCVKGYLLSLCLLALVALVYETVYLLSPEDDLCLYDPRPCVLYDREKMCKNTNTSAHHVCSDPSCVERLSSASTENFAKCFNKSWSGQLEKYIHKGCCHFLRRDGGRKAVMLASFPGSGNTWVRGLLERITGICTGSIYCDVSIRQSGIIGEFVSGPEVLVVKTHRKERWMDDKPAIFIIRDPAKAIVSYWNYRSSPIPSHRKIQPQTMFGENPDWVKFFNYAHKSWLHSVLHWTTNRTHSAAPLHILTYEDLKDDTLTEIAKIMKFLHLPFKASGLWTRLRSDYSVFHRHTHKEMDYYYTAEQRYRLLDMMTKLHAQLQQERQYVLASIMLSYINQHNKTSGRLSYNTQT